MIQIDPFLVNVNANKNYMLLQTAYQPEGPVV